MPNAITQDGLTAWSVQAISDVPVLSDTPAGGTLDLYAQACHGQTVPLSFCLRTERPCLVDITTGAECAQCRPQIDVKHVVLWWQNRNTSSGEKDPGLVPELLVNDPQFAVVQDGQNVLKSADADEIQPVVMLPGTHQYWLQVYVRPDLRSGRYTVPIVVWCNGQVCMTFPVTVDVLPFELPKPSMIFSMYHTSELETGKNLKTEAQYTAELRSMARRGIDYPLVWQDLVAAFAETPEPGMLDKVDRLLSLRLQEGLHNDPIYLARIGVQWAVEATLPGLISRLKRCKQFLEERGIHDVYVMGSDEANEETMRSQRPVFVGCHEVGFNTMMTIGSRSVLALRMFATELDLPMVNTPGTDPTPWQARNKSVWFYSPSMRENPYWHRKRFGLAAMRQGFDGVCPFALQQTMGPSPNDDLDANYKDHEYVHTTESGCVETIQLEGLGAAVDDVRFATLLRDKGGEIPDLAGRDLDEVRAEMVAQILLRSKG